ncbi:MAG: phosphatase PAP2 family protein [Pseudolabrys sp.]
MAALTTVSFAITGLSVDASHNLSFFAFLAILFALNAFYRFARPNRHLRTATETTAQLLLVLLFGILLTYAATAADLPYRDASLLAADRALGFDYQAYLTFFDAQPELRSLIGAAYLMLLPQFLAIPLVLLVARREARLQIWLLAVAVALILTSAIYLFVPSVTAFVYIEFGGPAHIPAHYYTPVPTIEALRAGVMHTVRLNHLEGLVTFPSFHTAGALLFVWALWPLRRLRWLAVALNAALISATPNIGGHYAVDVIAGAAVMLLSVATAKWLCSWVEEPKVAAMAMLYSPK